MVPATESWAYGDEVPNPSLPCASRTRAVEVAEAVEVEIAMSEADESERPSIVRRAPGVVEPIPKFPPLVKVRALEVAVPLVEVEM
jgi:hypothetical protein